MKEIDKNQMSGVEVPPKLPSQHIYWSLSIGVLLPLIIALMIWKRLQPSEFSFSKLFWAFLWTYPLMTAGCLAGEFLARRIHTKFYDSIGDNSGQMVNLFTGWLWAHVYLIFLFALFILLRKLASA
jgi:hypothetical protein